MDRILMILLLAMIPSSLLSQTLTPSKVASGKAAFLFQSSTGEVGHYNLQKNLTDTLFSDAIAIPNTTSITTVSPTLATLLPNYNHSVGIGEGSGADSLLKYLVTNPGAYASSIFITGNPDSLFKALVAAGMPPDSSRYIVINKYLLHRKIHGLNFNEKIKVPVYNPKNGFDSTEVIINNLIK